MIAVQIGAVVIISILFAILVSPFFKPKTAVSTDQDTTLQNLLEEKERIYTVLADLDFDHAGGKISDEDYKKMREEFVKEGVVVLNQIDQLRGETKKDITEAKVVEQEIAKFKQKRYRRSAEDKIEDRVEKEIAKFKKRKGRK